MFDVGFLREVPGMQIFCPASLEETKKMLRLAVNDVKGPVAIRYPTGAEGGYRDCCLHTAVWEGADLTVVTYGTMINEALQARAQLAEKGVSAEVLKLAKISDLDMDSILASVQKTKKLLVAEEVSNHGCVADEIFAALCERGVFVSMKKINLGDGYVCHGTRKELLLACGLDAECIERLVLEDFTVES
jgi:1-deoxy-D-xylulose-5-phosphate synthase